ncbi:CDF family Co(II)/Ni(II) efflux transporter DmeF [Sorangium sp. So ce117]|uniref:CDF family Co(II)/Ni(II) efflux transporter DmeF n=1 Tax=Sorangium sp. So ce117 TaxID=3133277 RepID=UPI003F61287F
MSDSMGSDRLAQLRHAHDHGAAAPSHEARTRWVVALTFAMMVAELVAGYATNSLALTADGWHMATHAGALGMSAFAYWFARKQSGSSAFSFGTGKVHALAGYTSAVVLALIALLMVVESLRRFLHPESIAFSEALPVAVVGLAVNLVSVKLLHADEHHHEAHDDHPDHDHHDHDHGHGDHDDEHAHGHDHHGPDHNLRAAYLHVLADALTSVLAILALLGGRTFGWTFLDAAMGIVGGLVIAKWSYGLCRQAARQLLDVVPSESLARRIRDRIESTFAGASVVDLHLWDIGPGARACIVSVAVPSPLAPSAYRDALVPIASLQHVTVEVHPLSAGDARGGS